MICLINSLLQISINGPDVFSKENDDVIRRAVKLRLDEGEEKEEDCLQDKWRSSRTTSRAK